MDNRFRFRVAWTFVALICVTTWVCLTAVLYISHEKFRLQNYYFYEREFSKNEADVGIKYRHIPPKKENILPKDEDLFESRSLSGFPSISYSDYPDDIIALHDVFISVKTSEKFHSTRLDLILRTWWNTAKEQIYIFTDVDDNQLKNRTDGHIINTKCRRTHHRQDLSCKIGQEYDAFIESGKKWWCHFDDDNYVNVDALLRSLRNYNWKSDVYLGKPSINHVVEAIYKGNKVHFWFATGGAGVCISRSLGEKMNSWSRHGKFQATSERLKLPDDCTLGFIINNRLGVELTKVDEFHSHLEQLSLIQQDKLSQQVSLSYFIDEDKGSNVIELDKKISAYSIEDDPTRFLSLHCLINPKVDWCSKKKAMQRNQVNV
uniref:beta-1,3-N-acetylglucosaminyltransferase radical fringe-like n=1 Tax=Styela clava TaxID=7725 RepID=UPI001939DFFE|nr:beta-1,3-N-acetylglucosaminyltransferase radical fringe-like [Styela clava]